MTRRLAALAILSLLACERPPPRAIALDASAAALRPPKPLPAVLAPDEPPKGDGRLHVYFFDVGHGDAALIVSPTGRTVLVDGGPEAAASHLLHRLPELSKGPIDLVVVSAPLAEHVGGLKAAVRSPGARYLAHPGLAAPALADVLAQASAHGAVDVVPAPPPDEPAEPVKIGLGGGAELSVWWPRMPVESALQLPDRAVEANSMVLRLQFGDTSLLLPGDAQAETEAYLLKRKLEFPSTLLKVAAHGSDRATTEPFLAAVRPKAALVSVGAGNALGLPAKATLDRLAAVNARVFRTDLDGEVRAVSDGNAWTLTTERPAAGEPADISHRFSAYDAPDAGTASPAKPARSPAKPARAVKKPLPADAAQTAKARPSTKAAPPEKAAPAAFVASRNSKVFHLPGCRAAKRIAPHNLVVFASREDAAKERRPAEDCKP